MVAKHRQMLPSPYPSKSPSPYAAIGLSLAEQRRPSTSIGALICARYWSDPACARRLWSEGGELEDASLVVVAAG
jgi:hypothetical protein